MHLAVSCAGCLVCDNLRDGEGVVSTTCSCGIAKISCRGLFGLEEGIGSDQQREGADAEWSAILSHMNSVLPCKCCSTARDQLDLVILCT
eukprot:2435541-Amphidinium_carterae.1